MTESTARTVLLTEGENDAHLIKHLLVKSGIKAEVANPGERDLEYSGDAPIVVDAVRGKNQLYDSMAWAQATFAGPLGFIFDADDSSSKTWDEMRPWLTNEGAELPKVIPPNGWIGLRAEFHRRLGIWVMPDNSANGTIEDFLGSLVPHHDQGIWDHACAATDTAADLVFTEPQTGPTASWRSKAQLRTWLAWRPEPGLPYGSAIGKGYFDTSGGLAPKFVKWVQSLMLA